MDLSSAASSDMTNAVDDVTVDTVNTDAAGGQKETTWQNSKWSQYLGYYKTIPEVKIAIDTRATWTVGKGYKSDSRTRITLEHFKGMGIDTFTSIMKNLVINRRIGGDAFAEIIRDRETGQLINLKPLDPGAMKIVTNKKGIIIRYEQISKTDQPDKKYSPDKIFHLTNKRVADEIHGVSDIEAIENIILANNESFDDMKKLMHRHVKPMRHFKLSTDNQTKIDEFIAKVDEMTNKGEDMYTPQGTVDFELVAVPSNATLNPLPWREHLRNYFFQVVGIPQIILGSSGEFTESTAKIAYLAFQQSVEDEQLDIEEQMWNQLFIEINFEFPASLQNELISDTKKDGENQQVDLQPADATISMGSGT